MPRALALLVLLSVVACDDEQEQAAPPPQEPAPEPAPVAGTRPIATPAAFDLVAVEGGAALVWGRPANDGGGVMLSRLDSLGGVRGEPVVVYAKQRSEAAPVPPDAVEISAAAGGGRLVIGFVARLQPEVHALATHGSESAETFAPVEDLSTMQIESLGGRGNIASAVGPDGRAAVMFRRLPGPCPDEGGGAAQAASGGACVGFGVRRLGGSPGGSSRDGVGLAAPSPCEHALAGYVWSAGVWHYGLCTRQDGEAATTLYAIQFEPEYAHADRVLGGCDPIGLAPTEDGALMVGRCDGSVGAVAISHVGQERLDLPRAGRSVACRDGRPTLSIATGERRVELALGAPLSGLAPWLAEEVAPPRSRACWTGDALLVAHPVARDVSLRRYQCVDGELVRTDTP